MSSDQKVLAVIPARGGSKGIPRKNLRPLAGQPLIAYTIDACLRARSVDHVVVSTDDDEIALFAERFGAEVTMRPPELAGGFSLVCLLWLAIAAQVDAGGTGVGLLLLFAAGVAGFLLFNLRHRFRRRATVFLGDAGSTMLAVVIAWYAIKIGGSGEGAIPPLSYAWLLVLPVMDMMSLTMRRIRRGHSPLQGDREHVHHVFMRAGYSPSETAYILLGATAVLGSFGLIAGLAGVPQSVQALGLVIVFGLHHYFITRAWRTMKVLKRMRGPGRSNA